MTAVLEQTEFMKTRAMRKQHDAIVDWTKKQFWRMKEDRASVERQWYLNLAFMFGKQYVAYRPTASLNSTSASVLWIPPAPSWRVRAVVNRVRPTVRTEIAQLTNNKPNATVVPASAEERDMYAAMAAEQVWQNLSSTKDFSSKLESAVWWNQVCGNGFLKTWWDFNVGTVVIPEADGKKMGQVQFAAESPFHIFVPDLLQLELQEQPYMIHAQMKSVEWVKMRYEGKLGELRSQETTGKEIFEQAFLNLVGAPSTQKQHSVLLLECYVKPGVNQLFPNGGFYTIIGDTIVDGYGQLPYSHAEFPFSKLSHIPSGKFYATSSIEDLIPLQKEYNRKYSQIIENANRMAKLQYMCEEGAVDPRKMTTEPGQMVMYRPGYNPPVPVTPPSLPAYVPQILDRLLLDWNDISGQHEVTHGQVPPGVTAATAISYLQERDETKLSPTFNSLERAIERTAKQALTLVHDYWTVEQTIQVTGPEGSFDSLTFKGSDIARGLDIRIESGSSLPTSKAARQAFILDLMKLGFVDPQDGLEVLDMGGMAKIYERVQTDRRQVQRENLRMAKAITPEKNYLAEYNQQNQELMQANSFHFGEEPVVDPLTGVPTGEMQPKQPPLLVPTNTWDDHRIHKILHNQYRKSQAFEMLPEEVKQLFEAHYQEHVRAEGVETITMDPRAAAGLPPLPPEGEQSQSQGTPGPEPMPELSGSTAGMGA